MTKQLSVWGLVLGMAVVAGAGFAADKAAGNGESPVLGTVTPDADQFFTLTTENDKYFGNTDRHYTNGFRANYTVVKDHPDAWVEKIGSVLPFVDVGGQTAMSYSLGHEIYTPNHIQDTSPSSYIGDVPYNGFLYGKAGFTTYHPDHSDTYELTLGTVGPSAQGEYVQKTVHEALDLYKPMGWKLYHLNDEPIVNISYLRRMPGYMSWTPADGWFADMEPRYGFMAGNAFDNVNTGVTFRFGPNTARHADTPQVMTQGTPGSAYFAKSPNWFDWYLFASLDGRAVARNIFLDGNTFRSSPHVEKIPLVGDAAAGLVVMTGPVKTSVSINQSTKEFQSQDTTDVYGAINVGYRF